MSVASRPAFVRLLNGFGLEYLATVFVLSLMAAAEGVAHPLLIKYIFDEGVLRSDFGRFLTFAVAYLVFGLLTNLAGAATAMWARSLENRIVAKTSRRAAWSLLRKRVRERACERPRLFHQPHLRRRSGRIHSSAAADPIVGEPGHARDRVVRHSDLSFVASVPDSRRVRSRSRWSSAACWANASKRSRPKSASSKAACWPFSRRRWARSES